MKFALLVTASPSSTQGADTALRFARAAISTGHSIERVFFFRDAVNTASDFSIYPQDEYNIHSAWKNFCSEHSIEAIVCVSAALKRGIVDQQQSQRHHLTGYNLSKDMQIGGLGLLTEAIIRADRVMTFG